MAVNIFPIEVFDFGVSRLQYNKGWPLTNRSAQRGMKAIGKGAVCKFPLLIYVWLLTMKASQQQVKRPKVAKSVVWLANLLQQQKH